MQNAKCKSTMQNAKAQCKMQKHNAKCKMQNSKAQCKMQNAKGILKKSKKIFCREKIPPKKIPKENFPPLQPKAAALRWR